MLVTYGIICRHFFKVFVESFKACFHLKLISHRWYKDEYISSSEGDFNEMIIGNPNSNHTLEFTQKYTINDFSDYDRQVSQNQLKYGTLMGETKKAIQFAIRDGDDELIQFIRDFNKRKEDQQMQAESVKRQEILANRRTNADDNRVIYRTNGVLVDSNEVLDPLKRQSKGRPPAKRLKSSIEAGSKTSSKNRDKGEQTADGGRKCGMCGENGHYRNTCSKN